MCECTTSIAQKMESATGFSDPAAKGARVKGTMPAEMILQYVSHVQTHSPRKHWLQTLIHGSRLDPPLKTPVVAAVGVVGVRDGRGVVCGANDLLRQRGQNLGALGCVEGGDAGRLGHGGELEGGSQLLGERAGDVGGGRRGHSLSQQRGTHDGGHCAGMSWCRDAAARRRNREQWRRQCLGSRVLTSLRSSLASGRSRVVT
jgi:hypothetical protein